MKHYYDCRYPAISAVTDGRYRQRRSRSYKAGSGTLIAEDIPFVRASACVTFQGVIMRNPFPHLFMAIGILLVPAEVSAQWSYSSPTAVGVCSDLPANFGTQFTLTPIVTRAKFPTGTAASDTVLARPIKMALDTSGGKLDIYFTEKYGKVRHYRGNFDGTDSSLRTVGFIPQVHRQFSEDGLWGIALDPGFKTNNFIYVGYAHNAASTTATANGSATVGWRISRFTLSGTPKVMDMSSEKVMLHIPAGVGNRWHTASSMHFDRYGNLYISVGGNEALFQGPGNTADLRGGILRIRPTPDGNYTIPSGNFGEHWAAQFEAQGRTALAAQYRDTSKVRPEIYVKGSRNPYVSGIDPHRLGWVTWSECGPDAQRNEEFNFATSPVFSGWPFWAGNAIRQSAKASSFDEPDEPTTTQWATYNPLGMSIANPVNTWPGTTTRPRMGVDSLPPMHQPTHYYTSPACANGAMIIRHDGRGTVPGKMPPHLDNVLLFQDFAAGATTQNIWAFKVDPATGMPTSTTATPVFTTANYPRNTTSPTLYRGIDFQQGPDGALYFLNWGAGCCDGNTGGQSAYAGIVRVTYTGTNCEDPALFPAPVAISGKPLPREEVSWLKVGARSFSVFAQGPHEAVILDVRGRALHSFHGEGPRNYNIPELGAKGIYVLRVKSVLGMAMRPIAGL
jgi:glucose/arabinose dehydrogenase